MVLSEPTVKSNKNMFYKESKKYSEKLYEGKMSY